MPKNSNFHFSVQIFVFKNTIIIFVPKSSSLKSNYHFSSQILVSKTQIFISVLKYLFPKLKLSFKFPNFSSQNQLTGITAVNNKEDFRVNFSRLPEPIDNVDSVNLLKSKSDVSFSCQKKKKKLQNLS